MAESLTSIDEKIVLLDARKFIASLCAEIDNRVSKFSFPIIFMLPSFTLLYIQFIFKLTFGQINLRYRVELDSQLANNDLKPLLLIDPFIMRKVFKSILNNGEKALPKDGKMVMFVRLVSNSEGFNNQERFASDANFESLDNSREIKNAGMLHLSIKLCGQKISQAILEQHST